jgi:hypothetical protein
LPGDIAANPFFHVWNSNKAANWGMIGLDVIDTRADLLAASDVLDSAAVDPYAFVRDAYLQKRRHAIFDGNPPSDPGGAGHLGRGGRGQGCQGEKALMASRWPAPLAYLTSSPA